MGNRITEPYGFIEETEYDSLRNQLEEACGNGAVIESGDGSLSVDTSNPSSTKIKVNVDQAEGNIITIGTNGLYASVALSYDSLTNTLTLATSDGKTTSISLLSNSLIDSISYNPTDETLIIKYTVNGVAMDDVVVPVSSLISEWEVAESSEGAVKLAKTRNIDGKDVLSASVVINGIASDNALVNENGGLYVSKDAILASAATKADIDAVNAELANKVGYTDIATEENPSRKAIVLANHDTILGTTTTGAAQNLVMMSKWDKADFGSASVLLNLNGSAERPTYNDEKEIALVDDLTPIQESLDGKVGYADISDSQNPNRKAITLANHDTILGTTTNGGTVNIAMVSKWDKVDLGSVSVQMNLNTANRVQVNDSEEIAYVSDVEQAVENANTQLEGINLVQKEELVYELQVGDRIAGTITLPKDQFLKSVTYNSETKVLTFTFETIDGEVITPIDISGLLDVYVAGDGISLASNAFSLKIDPTTQQYIEVSSEGVKIAGIDEALALKANATDLQSEASTARAAEQANAEAILAETGARTSKDEEIEAELASKVAYTDIATEENPNRKGIVLANHDTILGKTTAGAAQNLIMMSKWDKVDVGTAQNELNLNGSAEHPTYNDDKQIAFVDDVPTLEGYAKTEDIPTELPNPQALDIQVNGESVASYKGNEAVAANIVLNAKTVPMAEDDVTTIYDKISALKESVQVDIPLRTLQDKIYTEDEILDWFGVDNITDLRVLATREGQFYVEYGITLQGVQNYKMPVDYLEYSQPSNEIKLVFLGLDTRDDSPVKYEIRMNLGGTVLEGNSNVKITMTPLDKEIDLTQYVTADELQAQINALPQLEDVPTEELPERKAIVLKNGDMILGATTSGDTNNLVMMNRWDVADFGSSKVKINFNTPSGVRPTVQEAGQSGEEAHEVAYVEDVKKIIGNVDYAKYVNDTSYSAQILNKLEQSYIDDLGYPENINGEPYNAETNNYLIGQPYLSFAKFDESFTFHYDLYLLNGQFDLGYFGVIFRAQKIMMDNYDSKLAKLEERISGLESGSTEN